MFPQWSSPCGNQCTTKYAALMQIPWRVFCKKGCDSDGETWEDCLSECNEICYKDPVLKDQQWSAYIDRSPGADTYSAECFHACRAGCGYRFTGIGLKNFEKLTGEVYMQFFFLRSCALFLVVVYPLLKDIGTGTFGIPAETVDQAHPNRPPKRCIESKPPSPPSPSPSIKQQLTGEELPCTSA